MSIVEQSLIPSRDYLPKPPIKLPNELTDMVVDHLHDDTAALRACAVSARCFLPAARYHIFQRVTLNSAEKIDFCLDMLRGRKPNTIILPTRSLDIGFRDHTLAWGTSEVYWQKLAELCLEFGRLWRIESIWFSDTNFYLMTAKKAPKLFEGLSSLFGTVTELGVYECYFCTIEDFTSMICAFPRCDRLYIRGCGYGMTNSSALESFSKHKLSVVDFSIENFPFHSDADVFTVFNEIKMDCLKWLYCDIDHRGASRSILRSASHSVEHLEFSHAEYAFPYTLHPLRNMNRVKNLIISFKRAVDTNIFRDFASIGCVETIVLHMHASFAEEITTVTWENFDSIFPDSPEQFRLKKFDMRIKLRNWHLGLAKRKLIVKKLPRLISRKLLYFWDELYTP